MTTAVLHHTLTSPMTASTVESTPAPRIAYGIAETARMTGLGRTTLYSNISSGELPSIKVGKRRLVRHADLVHFLDRQRNML